MQSRTSTPGDNVSGVVQFLGKTTQWQTIGYWIVTTFLLSNLLVGSIAELMQRPEYVEVMLLLGYPIYIMLILGVWKALGFVALLVPGFPRLKEWAYAGIFFNMLGAAISHTIVGSAAWHIYYTGFLALLTLASWALRPPSRKLEARHA